MFRYRSFFLKMNFISFHGFYINFFILKVVLQHKKCYNYISSIKCNKIGQLHAAPEQVVIKHMKVVVAGVGKVGYAIVLQLSMENHDITAIDCSADALTYIQNAADVLTIRKMGQALKHHRSRRRQG